jgi:hypothetical protein
VPFGLGLTTKNLRKIGFKAAGFSLGGEDSTCLVALNKVKPFQPSDRLETVTQLDQIQHVTQAHQSPWTLPSPNTFLTLPDPELLTQNALAVQPMTLDSPYIPALPEDMVPPFVPAPRLPSPSSRRDAAVALITCVLVVIIGSLSNPIFVTVDSGLSPPHPFNLPCCQVPETMPHATDFWLYTRKL